MSRQEAIQELLGGFEAFRAKLDSNSALSKPLKKVKDGLSIPNPNHQKIDELLKEATPADYSTKPVSYLLQLHYLNGIYLFSVNSNFTVLRASVLLSKYIPENDVFLTRALSHVITNGMNSLRPSTQKLISGFSYSDSTDHPPDPGIGTIKEYLVRTLLAFADPDLQIKALMQALFFKDSTLGAIFARGKWVLTRYTDGSKKILADKLVTILDREPPVNIDAALVTRFQEACTSDNLSISDIKKHKELFLSLRNRQLITPKMLETSRGFLGSLFSSQPKRNGDEEKEASGTAYYEANESPGLFSREKPDPKKSQEPDSEPLSEDHTL